MRQFCDGIWLDSAPVRFLGLQLTSTMVVMQLAAENLLVYSPIQLTAERQSAVEALGKVRHLYVPNLFHHLRVGEWASAYPEARLHAPLDLSSKRPDLRIDRVHGAEPNYEPEPEFKGYIDEVAINGCRLAESVLVYRPARTLIVADLAHNIGQPDHLWTAIYTRAMGFHNRVGLSRMLRWFAFNDRSAARKSLSLLLEQSFDRMVMGHGEALESGVREALRDAYSWLPEKSEP